MVVIVLISIIAVLVVALFIALRKSRDYIIETVLESRRVNDAFGGKGKKTDIFSEPNGDYSTLESKTNRLERELNNLKNTVSELEKLYGQPKQTKASEPVQPKVQVPESKPTANAPEPKVSETEIYVEKLSNGLLKECRKERAQYKIIGTTKFEFCGDLEIAKANFDATFEGVCNVNGSVSAAKSYVTEQPGTVEHNGNYWKVLNKTTIKVR